MEINPQYASMKKIHDIKQSKPIFWNDMLLLISNFEHFDVGSQWYINELYRNTTEVLQCVREWNIDADELVQTICRLSKYSAITCQTCRALDLTVDIVVENGFGIRQNSNDCIGYGIYPVASYYKYDLKIALRCQAG